MFRLLARAGGHALLWLHKHAAASPVPVNSVHMDTLACMTGVSRFLQTQHNWHYSKVCSFSANLRMSVLFCNRDADQTSRTFVHCNKLQQMTPRVMHALYSSIRRCAARTVPSTDSPARGVSSSQSHARPSWPWRCRGQTAALRCRRKAWLRRRCSASASTLHSPPMLPYLGASELPFLPSATDSPEAGDHW